MKGSALAAPAVLFPHQPGKCTHSRLSKRCTEPWFLITEIFPFKSLESRTAQDLRKPRACFGAARPRATDVKTHVVSETGRDPQPIGRPSGILWAVVILCLLGNKTYWNISKLTKRPEGSRCVSGHLVIGTSCLPHCSFLFCRVSRQAFPHQS